MLLFHTKTVAKDSISIELAHPKKEENILAVLRVAGLVLSQSFLHH